MGSSAGLLQRCLAAGEYTEAQQWQQLLQHGWLWPLALTHRRVSWVQKAAQPHGWVCKARMPSAQPRGALWGSART